MSIFRSKKSKEAALFHPLILAILLLNTAGILVLFFKIEVDTMQVGKEISIVRNQITPKHAFSQPDSQHPTVPPAPTDDVMMPPPPIMSAPQNDSVNVVPRQAGY